LTQKYPLTKKELMNTRINAMIVIAQDIIKHLEGKIENINDIDMENPTDDHILSITVSSLTLQGVVKHVENLILDLELNAVDEQDSANS